MSWTADIVRLKACPKNDNMRIVDGTVELNASFVEAIDALYLQCQPIVLG
jgi:hypothetical protein